MDELNPFVRPYLLTIKDGAGSRVQTALGHAVEEVHAAVIVKDGEVVDFSVFSDRAAAEARIVEYAQERYEDDEEDDDVALPHDSDAAQEYLSESRSWTPRSSRAGSTRTHR